MIKVVVVVVGGSFECWSLDSRLDNNNKKDLYSLAEEIYLGMGCDNMDH